MFRVCVCFYFNNDEGVECSVLEEVMFFSNNFVELPCRCPFFLTLAFRGVIHGGDL